MRWPFKRKQTERRADTYTDTHVASVTSRVGGDAPTATASLATVQASAGWWARAFAAADVQPARAAAALTPSVLFSIGRAAILQGESVWAMGVRAGRIVLRRSSDWEVMGTDEIWYRLQIPTPDGDQVEHLPAAGVLHPRWNVSPAAWWSGRAPWASDGETSGLAGAVDSALRREAAASHGRLIPAPTEGMQPSAIEELKDDLGNLRGQTAMVPSMQRGWGEGGVGPGSVNWRVARLGLDPPDAVMRLREQLRVDMLTACGVPPELAEGSADGTGRREAWRQFLHGSVQPAAKLLEEEASEKMEADVRLTFDSLFASDVQGRARAFQALTAGGLQPAEAARATGVEQ